MSLSDIPVDVLTGFWISPTPSSSSPYACRHYPSEVDEQKLNAVRQTCTTCRSYRAHYTSGLCRACVQVEEKLGLRVAAASFHPVTSHRSSGRPVQPDRSISSILDANGDSVRLSFGKCSVGIVHQRYSLNVMEIAVLQIDHHGPIVTLSKVFSKTFTTPDLHHTVFDVRERENGCSRTFNQRFFHVLFNSLRIRRRHHSSHPVGF
ncbi:hypothetical protein C8R44DRAFT_70 [Mycena epipterygia]|nr:hypothetical protein C8R44DRAFT_70 [Mycena epipterygia]